MSVRINARLGDEVERKLEYLQAHTGKSLTEVVKASIETYYEQLAGPAGASALLESFIGCGSGTSDLSATYKAELAGGLDQKHPPQPPGGRR